MTDGVSAAPRKQMAIDKLLEWVYRDQRADLIVGMGAGLMPGEAEIDGVALQGSSACGCVALGRIAELGYRIDGGGGPAGHLHEDAERLHERVMRLPKPIALMVIRNARAGTQPDCSLGKTVQARPIINARGKPTIRFDQWDTARNYGWCPVAYTISLARIEASRAEYTFWHDALMLIAEDRSVVLVRHQAMPPSVPREPWEKTSRRAVTNG